jgi:Short C-terminal domain
MRRFATGLLIVISSLCLFLSSTSLWVRHNVINTGVFVGNVETIVDLPAVQSRVTDQVTATVMTNPRVTDAIDSAVAALPPRLRQFKPTVTNGIQSLVSTGVRRLLAAQPFRPLVSAAVTTAHDQLVNGQPLRFTLGQAKARIPASAKTGLAGQVLGLLPNDVGVTILTPADAPRLYNAIDVLKSLWWWVGLIGLAALAGALGISRRRRGTLRAWAVTTSVLAFLLLITLRVARGSVLVQVKAENRDAVGAIYDVLAGSLRAWTLWLLAIGLFVLVETIVWGKLGIVSGVRRGSRAAREQLHRYREGRAASAQAAAAESAAAGVPPSAGAEEAAAELPWTRRVVIGTRAFVDSLELSRRSSHLGGYVRDHFDAARWTGIVLGVFVLLIWPSPTLSVLIWIGAVVALWIGALVWLRNQAPAQARADEAEALPPAGTAAGTAAVAHRDDGGELPSVPAARQPSNGVPAPRSLQEPVLRPEVLSSLGGRLDLLVRLGAAHDAGVLTDEEFEREKSRLLAV